MADTYFVGMRGTSDLVTSERPESWRAGILRLFPNGMAPLTALTALMRSESLTDFTFNWWTKTLTTQRATVSGTYTDTALSSAYGGSGTAGQTLYVKMSLSDSKYFRPGHQVMFRYSSDYTVDCVGKVTNVVQNGANSYVAVLLLEDDDNSTDNDISDADVLLVIGSVNPQGGNRPEAITQGPQLFTNYTQIFRDALDLTRTLMQTKLRTADAYQEAKRDVLEQHSIQMEKAFLWGIKTLGTGSNSKPESTTDGLINFIRSYGTVDDYSLNTDYAGHTWLEAGHEWLNNFIETIFRYGSSPERLVFCGSGALLGIQQLAEELGMYQISRGEEAFGIKVTRWETVFGTLVLKTHPLFSYEETNRNSMVVFEPKNIRYRYLQDTIFKPDNSDTKGGGTGKDGKEEEYLTEAGLEFHFPETCAYLNGIGVNNTLAE